MVSRTKVAVSLGVVAVAAISLLAASWAGASGKASYPRKSTLITSGTQWGNIAGFNPYVGNYATGMVGLVNETLLRYDPLSDAYIPWLASKAGFSGAKYVITVRSGVKWSDGTAFTTDDVVYNLNLGNYKTAFWNTLMLNVKSVSAAGNDITVTFKKTPNYDQWQNLMWNLPMIQKKQASTPGANGIHKAADLTTYSPADPVGTGPYVLDTAGYDPTTRAVWKKKTSGWWAAQQNVSPSPVPTYIIDLCNTSNTNALTGLLTDVEDLNNNYLPGVVSYVKQGKMQTYYPIKPYDLTANTAWLTPNTTRKPLSDPLFRKALATSINVNNIVTNDYGNLVLPASATGLIPTWKKWINTSLVKKYGFKFSTAKAVKMLKKAGYKIKKGYFRNKNGSAINLGIAVPQGWSDWESARDMIIASAKKAHIKLTAIVGDFSVYQNARNIGGFDLVIDNTYQLSDNPWTYFNGLFHLPVISLGTGQTFANFQRYSNAKAFALVKKLDATPLSNTKARKALMSAMEKIELTQVPNIPLWYNGVWSQTQTSNWTNWPSSVPGKGHYIPCMWRGYLQMTGIDMFTHVKKA